MLVILLLVLCTRVICMGAFIIVKICTDGFDEAYEEVVAQAMQRFLTDSNFIEHLSALQKKDANLAKRLINKLKEILDSIRTAYQGMDTHDRASQSVKEMGKAIDELYAKMEEGLIAASEASQKTVNRNAKTEDKLKNDALFQYIDTDSYTTKGESRDNYTEYDKQITVQDIEELRSIGRKNINEFTSEDIQKSQKWAYKFNKELGIKSPFFRARFGDWRANSKNPIVIADIPVYVATNEARKANRGTFTNIDTKWEIAISREGETNTISHSGVERLSEYGLSGIKGLVENAILLETEIHDPHKNNAKKDLIAFDHKLYVLGKGENGIGLYRITVEEYYNDPHHTNNKRFHNLKYIKKVADVPVGAFVENGHNSRSAMESSTTNYNISDLYSLVKRYDKDFKPGKPINPALLNKDGSPKIVYHYTNANFTEFDLSKKGTNQGQTHGDGIYLSTNANEFSYSGKNKMELYANIRKPFEMHLTNKQATYILEKYAAKNHDLNKYDGLYRNHAMSKLTSPTSVFDYLKEYAADNSINVSDILKELGFDGVHDGSVWVAFDKNQIKSTDNIGTYDDSIGNIYHQYKDVNSIDNRTLLSNALEGVVKNDIEKAKLKEYKSKIELINAEENKLREIRGLIKEISFSKGMRDTDKLNKLRIYIITIFL